MRPQPSQPPGDRQREGNRPGPCRATRVPARADAVVRRARARVDVRHGREGADVSVGVRPRAVPRCLPATEHAVPTLDRGRVSWWRDDLTLAPCTKPGVCPGAPVEIVANTEVSSTRSEVRANTAVNPTRRNRPVRDRPACLDRGRAVRRTGAFRSPELVVSGSRGDVDDGRAERRCGAHRVLVPGSLGRRRRRGVG